MNVLKLFLKYMCMFIFTAMLLQSCTKSALDEYYEQPADVGSNIWDELQKEGRFTQFLSAIDKLDHEKSLQFSLITVLAPPDDVFNKFLSENGYGSVDDIPLDELKYIIEFHLIDWPHASGELHTTPEFFKRKTRSAKPNFVETDEQGAVTHYVNYNKYAQFFFDSFFEYYQGDVSDYKFLTGRDFEELHVYDAKVTAIDRRFGNGWVHEIDKVIVPPVNMDEWLSENSDYSLQFSMINKFNEVQRDGSGVAHGNDVEGNKLYAQVNNLFPKANWMLGFWPKYEAMGQFGGAHAPLLRGEKGLTLIASTNHVLQSFMDDKFAPYNEKYGADYIDSIPKQIIREVIYPTTFENLILPSKIMEGRAINNELQTVDVDIAASDAKVGLCSNGIVYGVSEYQVPRMFKGVSKTLLTDPKYSKFAIALQKLGVLSALRDADLEFTILAPTNDIFDAELIEYIEAWDAVGNLLVKYYQDDEEIPTVALTDIVYSHILFGKIEPSPNTNYYKCYGGWYVALNDTSAWSGGNIDYAQIQSITGSPEVDNGNVIELNNFVVKNLNTLGAEIYNRPEFSKFKELCEQVGMFDSKTKALNFVIYPFRYSAFIPSNEILEANADAIPEDLLELEQFIKYHFIRDDIFSNGVVSGNLNTAYMDTDNTTDYQEVYFKANVFNSMNDLSVQGISNTDPIPTTKDNKSNIICFDGVLHTINGILKY